MQLIAMHQKYKRSNYIEAFHEIYKCLTLWNDSDGLQISCATFFDYSSENRVPKYTNPFS